MCELYRNNEDEYSYFSSIHGLQYSRKNLSAIYYINKNFSAKNIRKNWKLFHILNLFLKSSVLGLKYNIKSSII